MLDFSKLSYWEKETYINHTDYLVVGSGIVGLSTAIHLKQRQPNKKVTVLVRGYLPTGASSKNAGFACIGSPSELLADMHKMPKATVFETLKKRWDGFTYLRSLLGDEAIGYKNLGAYELFTKKEQSKFEFCKAKLDYLNIKLKDITGIDNVFKVDDKICSSAQFKNFEFAISHAAEGQINTGKMIDSLVKLSLIHISEPTRPY